MRLEFSLDLIKRSISTIHNNNNNNDNNVCKQLILRSDLEKRAIESFLQYQGLCN